MITFHSFDETRGLARITIGNKTAEVPAFRMGQQLMICHLAVKIGHGSKVWAGRVMYSLDKQQFHSVQAVNYQQNGASTVTLLGFYADHGPQARSQHSGQR